MYEKTLPWTEDNALPQVGVGDTMPVQLGRKSLRLVNDALVPDELSEEDMPLSGEPDVSVDEQGADVEEKPESPSPLQLTPEDDAGLPPIKRLVKQAMAQEPGLLSGPEEIALAQRIEQGDQAAREKFILANVRLVVSIAKNPKFQRKGVELDDLVQEGMVGLLKAVQRFEWQRGNKFSTYATTVIEDHVRKSLSNSSRTVRAPADVASNMGKVRYAQAELRHTLGREPTDKEIATDIGVEETLVTRVFLAAHRQPTSLNRELDEDGTEVGELLGTPDNTAPVAVDRAARNEENKAIGQAFEDSLDQRERTVLGLRFGLGNHEPKSLEETALAMNVNKERVRVIEQQALRQLSRDPTLLAKVLGKEDAARPTTRHKGKVAVSRTAKFAADLKKAS